MKLINLFFTFFKIGLFTFGGGYAMIPMIKEAVVSNGWLTTTQIIDFIGISESTPGPFAVNIATFVGNNVYGIWGSAVATLGVVMPSFIIILIIAKFFAHFADNKNVKYLLSSIRPCIIGLILSATITISIAVFFKGANSLSSIIIFSVAFILSKIPKLKISPIVLITLSGIMGILLNG